MGFQRCKPHHSCLLYTSKAATEIQEKIQRVKSDLAAIDALDSKYKLNAKDVYVRTLDMSQAMAENARLIKFEEQMEADRKRKAEEEEMCIRDRLQTVF